MPESMASGAAVTKAVTDAPARPAASMKLPGTMKETVRPCTRTWVGKKTERSTVALTSASLAEEVWRSAAISSRLHQFGPGRQHDRPSPRRAPGPVARGGQAG